MSHSDNIKYSRRFDNLSGFKQAGTTTEKLFIIRTN